MKLQPRTPLLVLGAIGLSSLALLLIASSRPASRNVGLHLLIKEMTKVDVSKFDAALPSNDSDYSIDYFHAPPNHPPHKGKLEHPCPQGGGNKVNINVTQQVSFKSTGDLKTFLDKAFAP